MGLAGQLATYIFNSPVHSQSLKSQLLRGEGRRTREFRLCIHPVIWGGWGEDKKDLILITSTVARIMVHRGSYRPSASQPASSGWEKSGGRAGEARDSVTSFLRDRLPSWHRSSCRSVVQLMRLERLGGRRGREHAPSAARH